MPDANYQQTHSPNWLVGLRVCGHPMFHPNLHYTSNYAEFDGNAWILPNFQLKHVVKITATIIYLQTKPTSTWAPSALITIISLFGS